MGVRTICEFDEFDEFNEFDEFDEFNEFNEFGEFGEVWSYFGARGKGQERIVLVLLRAQPLLPVGLALSGAFAQRSEGLGFCVLR